MICHFRCCTRLLLHNPCRTSDGAAGLEHGWVYANVGGIHISDPDCNVNSRCYVLIRLFFSGLLHLRDLHKKEETMVFEAHGMQSPLTELLGFNNAKVSTVFHSMAPLINLFIY